MSLYRFYVRALTVSTAAIALCILGLGLAYPGAVWALSRLTADSAEGHLVYDNGRLVASTLLDDGRAAAEPDAWFYGRPKGMSNLGPTSEELAASIHERRQAIAQREGVDPAAVPADAVTGSGSGVDAGISPEYADLQVPRVAREHNLSPERVRELVHAATTQRSLRVLGESTVNVTQLNLSLPGGARCR